MSIVEKHIVGTISSNRRLTDYAIGIFTSISTKSGLKKAIKKGHVSINGERAKGGYIIKENDVIELTIEAPKTININTQFDIIYEDDYLAVINKPSGIEVSGNKKACIKNRLPGNIKISKSKDALPIPVPAHRLDYPTTGCLIIAKTFEALRTLNQMFKANKIKKKYLAITINKMPTTGIINTDIDGKIALSKFQTLKSSKSDRYKIINLVEISIETGRTHQIRKHLSSIGNPILRDTIYGKDFFPPKGKNLYLHALEIHFTHPFTNEILKITAPIPKKFNIFN